MSLQDELRKAVADRDTFKVQDLLDRMARQRIDAFARRINAIKTQPSH